jgi:hypothetical protein
LQHRRFDFRTFVIAGLAMGALAALPPRPAWGQCTKDSDCKGTRICEGGACVEAPPDAAHGQGSAALQYELAEAKKKYDGTVMGLALGFSLGVVFLVPGAVLTAILDNKVIGAILLAGGAAELVIGIVCAAILPARKKRLDLLKRQLGIAAALDSPHLRWAAPPSRAGLLRALPGRPDAATLGLSYSFSF